MTTAGTATGLRIEVLADIVRQLHHDPRLWARRRYDQTTLRDVDSLDWTTRFEIRIPTIDLVRPGQMVPIPLLLRGKSISPFEIVGEPRAGLRLMGWADSRAILEQLLLDLAKQAVAARRAPSGPSLNAEVVELLRRLLDDLHASRSAFNTLVAWSAAAQLRNDDSTHTLAPQLIRNLLGRDAAIPSLAQGQQVATLFGHKELAGYMREFADAYLVLAAFPYEGGAEHTVHVRHHERATHQAVATVGGPLRQTTANAIALNVGTAISYHAEIILPSGVHFRRPTPVASIALPRPQLTGEDRGALSAADAVPIPVLQELHSGNFGASPPGDGWRLLLVSDDRLVVHATASRREARVVVLHNRGVRIEREGVGGVTLPMVSVTLVVFLAGLLLRACGATVEDSGGAALILTLVSAFSAYFLEREEWTIQRRVARWPRRCLLMALGLAAGGAATLVLHFPRGNPPVVGSAGWGWRGLFWALLSTAAAVLFVVTVWQSRRW